MLFTSKSLQDSSFFDNRVSMPSKPSQDDGIQEEGVLLRLRVLQQVTMQKERGVSARTVYCLGTVAKFRGKHGFVPPNKNRNNRTKLDIGTYMVAFDHGESTPMTIDEVVDCANLYYKQVSNFILISSLVPPLPLTLVCLARGCSRV